MAKVGRRELPEELRRVKQYAGMFTQSESDRVERLIKRRVYLSGSELVRDSVMRTVAEAEAQWEAEEAETNSSSEPG